jgi:SET domain-containing protein
MYSPNDLQIRPSRIDGLGIFAVRAIPPETRLLEYVGKRLNRTEYAGRHDHTYIFQIDEDHVVDGASSIWNPAAFFNHSCEPNCEACYIDGGIWIVTRRDIKPGEELTFNYGYTLRNVRQNRCSCGAPGCVGYIVAEEHFPEVKRMREGGELPR